VNREAPACKNQSNLPRGLSTRLEAEPRDASRTPECNTERVPESVFGETKVVRKLMGGMTAVEVVSQIAHANSLLRLAQFRDPDAEGLVELVHGEEVVNCCGVASCSHHRAA
jgi:hypothetical protein